MLGFPSNPSSLGFGNLYFDDRHLEPRNWSIVVPMRKRHVETIDLRKNDDLTEEKSPFSRASRAESDDDDDEEDENESKRKKAEKDLACSKLKLSLFLSLLGGLVVIVCLITLYLRHKIANYCKNLWPFRKKKSPNTKNVNRNLETGIPTVNPTAVGDISEIPKIPEIGMPNYYARRNFNRRPSSSPRVGCCACCRKKRKNKRRR